MLYEVSKKPDKMEGKRKPECYHAFKSVMVLYGHSLQRPFTNLDDLMEISDVYAFCLHDLHDDAVHVTEVRIAVARSSCRRTWGGDVAAGTTYSAVP